ncbi:acyl--CoA ligase [Xanthobacter dioxanivorans]|uniref:3-methylmercaptopropionyl-CoA ligase n=1 Tax=Xanthobacter dioxanivorans TaxID=2528964 RepID=A0A974SJW7_9HYPH|nr:class I adenylate-forming enzyme family protein [Xanthobacter dioxanivorans]QRG08876.1 acyl--CoA ligase [Xanthobacter dioxanivorans]
MGTHSFTLPLPESIAWRTPLALLDRNGALYPDKLALVAPSLAPTGEARLTYGALARRVDQAAAALREAGLASGDHLGILMTNTAAAEYVTTALGAMRAGAIVVPLNARFALPELCAAIADMECTFLVHEASHDAAAGHLAEAFPALSGRVIRIGVDGDWAARLDRARVRPEEFPRVQENDVADILLTSGTTGRPKGVMLTHANAVATGIAVAGALSLGPEDTYQSPFPLFTSSGFHFNIMATLWAGATLVIEPAVDVEATLARMTRERTTVYCAVPAIYIFMLDAFDPGRHDVSAMRVFDYGGAPMAREVIRRLAEAFPHVELRQTYGLTEAGPTGTFLAGRDALRKIGSVGMGMPLCTVDVARPDGSRADDDEMGELVMRGPAVSQGYYKNPKATAATFHDGWLWTGDYGRRDAEGYLYYMDRRKDVIIRGGFNITSTEVENAIFEHPGVKEVAVVGIPHQKLGEDLCAFIVPKTSNPATDELSAFVAERIADFKVPRRWIFVSELPRNPTGKIQKHLLRARAELQLGINAGSGGSGSVDRT